MADEGLTGLYKGVSVAMMYITKIKLKNVRCFDEAEIDLSGCKPGTSILIAGNNGIGKSAILRAIAMGLCDRDSAASLLRELEGNFVRKQAQENKSKEGGEKKAEIEIELKDENRKSWKITTTVTEWKELIIETVEQVYRTDGRVKSEFKDFYPFWDALFVTGYGAGLRTTGTAKYSDYFAPDAVYSLFKYDAPLQDPEIAWTRMKAASRRASKRTKNISSEKVDENISEMLKYVLDLDENAQIVLEPNGIYVKENGELIPLDAMGDGHKSLIKVTLDILVWYLLKLNYDKKEKGEDRPWVPIPTDNKNRPDVRGIVIIDEIEQHLHPKLQREVLKRLHDKFPKIQFIITTHSPLCVSGTGDVSENGEEGYKVFSVYRDNAGVALEQKEVPHGLRANQILLDYFDLETTLSISAANEVKRIEELLNITHAQRSLAQKRELARLLKIIEKYNFSLAESYRDRGFQQEAFALLRRDAK
jgi:energy-coupling factor transporter ATP-binding protein EcfA2